MCVFIIYSASIEKQKPSKKKDLRVLFTFRGLFLPPPSFFLSFIHSFIPVPQPFPPASLSPHAKFRGRNFVPRRRGKCYLRAKPSSSPSSAAESPFLLVAVVAPVVVVVAGDTALGFRLKFPLSQSNSYFPRGSCHATIMEASRNGERGSGGGNRETNGRRKAGRNTRGKVYTLPT